jgi:serine/threonine protein kinase
MIEEELFHRALEKPTLAEQLAFLDEVCADQPELRQRVERLLRSHRHEDSFLQPGVATEAPVTEQSGAVIGPYKLLEQIGEGGMGTVWMAEQKEPIQRRVAVKVIKAGMDSTQVLARFEAERQALALMDHPNIARVLDAGTTDAGRPYFVMELVKGTPITKYCDDKHLTVRERLELFGDVCRAVQHAHQKGIIHRDLKPSNILIAPFDDKPVVKVIDFGVAKATGQRLTDATLFTGFGAVVGTPEYMSPEQAETNNQDIDTRSDIYSLGVLLYELLTGSTPLTKKRVKEAALLEVLRVIREEEPAKPSTRLSSTEELPAVAAQRHTEPAKLTKLVRGELDWIVMKALEKDRNRRYETANGFAMDVQRYLADEPVQACPPSALYRLRKFVHRRRGPVLAGILLLLALILGIVGTSIGMVQANRARDDANANAAAAIKAAEAERLAKNEADRAAAQEREAKKVADERRRQAEAVANVLESLFDDLNPRTPEKGTLDIKASLLPRLNAAEAQLKEQNLDPLTAARLQNALGVAYLGLGETQKALALLQIAKETRMALLGPDNPYTLVSMHNWAAAQYDAGKAAQTIPLLLETLEKRKAILGEDHPDTLRAANNLAATYNAAGKLDLALPLYVETLRKRKAKLGADHPDTLMSAYNLAAGYREAGKLDLAIPLYVEAFEKRKEMLGADHPETLMTMNALAWAYLDAGKLELALPLFQEALEKLKAKLGVDHRLTLQTMNNLAAGYLNAGKVELALPLFQETLEKRKAKLGADHPDTLQSLGNLAAAYFDAGKFDLAVRLSSETLQKCKRILGEDHPQTFRELSSLALFYKSAGKLDLAIPLYFEALEKQKAKLGADHPDTLATMNNLASAYRAAGKLDLALPLALETLEKRKAKLGADHPGTLSSMSLLASVYGDARKFDRAVPLRLETLEKRKAKLGADHPDTLVSINNLAATYRAAGKLDLALPLYVETFEKRKARLGPDHPETLNSMSDLAEAYFATGKLELALPLISEALDKMRARLGPSHPNTQNASRGLAIVLNATRKRATDLVNNRKYADAERLLLLWMGVQRPRVAADDLQLAEPLNLLGTSQLMQNKLADAEKSLRESLAISMKKAPLSALRHDTESQLGATLAGQKRFPEAEPLLTGSAKAFLADSAKLSPADRKLAQSALRRVIDFYSAQGKEEEAARWRKRRDEAFPPEQKGETKTVPNS